MRCRFCGGSWETITNIVNCGEVDDHLGREWTEWKRERLGEMGEGKDNGWLRLLGGKPDKTRGRLEHGRGGPGHITEVRRERM